MTRIFLPTLAQRFAPVGIVLAIFVAAPQSASADFLGSVGGILTDPFKLGKASDNAVEAVERAGIHAERIQKQLDESAKARLSQLDVIIKETRDGLDQTIDHAFDRINQAQGQLMSDTAQLIKCSTEISTEIIKTKLSESLNDLGKRKPRLEIFGWVILEAKIEPQDIVSPIGSFREVKALYDDRLARVKPDDHPSTITDIYAELERIAALTKCHYAGDSDTWLQLYNFYELENIRRQNSWSGLVKTR